MNTRFILVICFCSFLFTGYSFSEKQVSDVLTEHIKYNSESNGTGNYFIYYSPTYSTSPITALETSDWLKEDPLGIMPLATELRNVLSTTNNRLFKDDQINYTGKLQHYVMVIDLPVYNKVETLIFLNKFKETYNVTGSTKKENFEAQLETRYNDEIEDFNVVEIFTPDAKILVTFAFVKRVVVDNLLSIEVVLKYGISKNMPYSKINEYIIAAQQKFNLEQNLVTTQGLNILVTDVYYFIETFWGDPTPYIGCFDLTGHVSSTIASEFITARCSAAGDYLQNKYALMRSAQFIDLLEFVKNNTTNSIVENVIIGDIQSRYFNWLDLFLAPYFAIPEEKPNFDIWLRDNYLIYDPEGVRFFNIYKVVFLGYFFDFQQPSFDRLAEMLTSSLEHYSGKNWIEQSNTLDPFQNWIFNEKFNDGLKWLYNGGYSEQERESIYTSITGYTNIQEILYEKILNPTSLEVPLLGPSSVEIAKNLVPLITEFNQSPTPEYEPENTVPIKVGLPLFTTRIENPQIYEGYKDQIVTTLVNDKLKFDLSICRANCNTTDGFINCNDCIEILGTHSKTVNFFDNVYSVIIHHPGYNELCTENSELEIECKNFISLEPAFFTVTKVRQEQFDEFIQDVSLDIALVTLPFSFPEFAATQAAGIGARVLHGIWVGSDVLSLFTEDQAAFSGLCNSVFGEELGPSITSKIILINGLVQLSQLGSTISSTKFLKTVNDPNFSSGAAAIQKYLEEYKLHTGQDLPKLDNESTITLGSHIKRDYTAGVGADAEPLIKIKHAELYGLERPVDYVLSADKENLRKLINRCRHKTSTFNPPPTIGQKRIHQILNDFDQEPGVLDLLVDDLNGISGGNLIAFFEAAEDAVDVERRLLAWKSMLSSSTHRNTISDVAKVTQEIEKHAAKLNDFVDEFANASEAGRQILLDRVDVFFGFKPGKFSEDITSISPPNRPPPSDYLIQQYIDDHIEKFNSGVTKIIGYMPTGPVGPPGGTFIMPSAQADEIIDQANGNVSVLEELLGKNPGELGSSPYRVNVSNPSGTRMPDGNEIGANNNWLPGGKTNLGVLEATVDQIQPGTYTYFLVF